MSVTINQWATIAGVQMEPVPLPQPHDTQERPMDCEDCGEPMEWNDAVCGDENCDCQHYSPRVHFSTGYASCGKEGI